MIFVAGSYSNTWLVFTEVGNVLGLAFKASEGFLYWIWALLPSPPEQSRCGWPASTEAKVV
jgi:hypothetical protein